MHARLMHHKGDTEKNPSRNKGFSQMFSIGHLNLNSLVAHDFKKVASLNAYLSVQIFDIFYISKAYLNPSITEDDDSLCISGYDLIRFDDLANNKKGGVAIYYKNILPLTLIDLNSLNESILFELQIESKT